MNNEIKYSIKKSHRARRWRISIYRDGKVVVTAPWYAPKFLAEKIVQDKLNWIKKKLLKFKNQPPILNNGGSKIEYKKNKEAARELVLKKLLEINQSYNFSFKRVSIRHTKTRWGSCSKQGNLNFNYRIIFLPSHLADYLITHELCHLKEMNHSNRFWSLVSKTLPNYKELRQELRGVV